MRKLRLLLVDDEPLAHKVLEGYVQQIDFVEVVGNCYSGIDTINFLNKTPIDAMLLDIQMPDLTGLELLETLGQNGPKVIFTTAHTKFALQSFEYEQVIDYLHKPIRLSRFLKSLERLKKQLALEGGANPNPPAVSQKEETAQDFLSVRDNKVVYKIFFSDIQYIQAFGNYLKIFLDDGEMKIARKPIKEVEKTLPADDFVRIHKPYLVNTRKVLSLQGREVMLSIGKLPIGKSFLAKARDQIVGRET
ncbi:MAG: LytTR family DNA-binding domain-containing protein [Bacteroidota bacterium]